MGNQDHSSSRDLGGHPVSAPENADCEALALIRRMAAEKVKFDQENYDAIPKDYVGLGFTVEQYWRARLQIAKSWQAFCADPLNHPGRKSLSADGPKGQDGQLRDEPKSAPPPQQMSTKGRE